MESKGPEESVQSSSGKNDHFTTAGAPPTIFPVDFSYWKLAPPTLGLLSLGAYAGFRKQVGALE